MDAKICGVKNISTLKYIINHKHPPKFIGFITNFKKSKRYVEYEVLKKLTNINKRKINFVAVLVSPDEYILEKIKDLNFDYYQLYDVSPEKTKIIKDRPLKIKSEIIEQLWKILISDNKVDLYESNLMRRICGLIYFSDKESGEIKMRVIKSK